jgi:hypothetical protein
MILKDKVYRYLILHYDIYIAEESFVGKTKW